MVGVLVLASLVAWLCPQMFAPTDIQSAVPAAVLHSPGFTDLPTAATACSELEPGYPCFSPMQYAVGVALPVADLTRSAAWQPVGWAYYVMGGLRRLSWALTALLLAGVTGLLRKT
jgi:hypothetical protein